MASRLDEATFLLVGGSDDQVDRWRNKARKKRVENIRFEGFVPVSEIPAYLSAANILVMPYDTSQTDGVMDLNTTSPLKLFEYMAAQRPIISTDISAISRTIEHEENGLLAPPNDIETLVSYVRRVLENKTFADQLSQNARADAEAYSWEKRCERMIKAFV
jgi:glycosyltransferase involved in cell wall biosynthesis